MVGGKTVSRAFAGPTAIAWEQFEVLPDEELLGRFLDLSGEESEAAFRALVVRHGPLVLGVCRRVLGQQQDAEDAFQATFLALARKAGSIHDRRVLGSWLYEVAYRIAIRAKTDTLKRRAHERHVAETAATPSDGDAGWDELRPILLEEVNRLPEKYRTLVVMCYLQGKTNEEVARLLQWPVGTVKGRLFRAREILRGRLSRRGLVLGGAFLVTALPRESVLAEVVAPNLLDVATESAVTARTGASTAFDGFDQEVPSSRGLRPRMKPVAVIAVVVILLGVTGGVALAGAAGWIPSRGTVLEQAANMVLPFIESSPPATACH